MTAVNPNPVGTPVSTSDVAWSVGAAALTGKPGPALRDLPPLGSDDRERADLAAERYLHAVREPSEPIRPLNMYVPPDIEAQQARKRDAVRAVLRQYGQAPIAQDVIVDELIAAAETGI